MNEWMNIYIAHISSQFCFECSRRLADVLAISSGCLTHERDQRYAATGARSTVFNHIEIHACWVFWCFCNPPNSDMDYRIFIVRAWSSACVHTLDLGLTSHPKDGVHSALASARSLVPSFWIFAVSSGFDPAPFGSSELWNWRPVLTHGTTEALWEQRR